MSNLLLHGGTIVRADGMEEADVVIEDGVISAVGPRHAVPIPANTEIMNVENELLFPGLIDCHVHFREPGLTHKATMRSEALAARAGGVTTVCEMPNTVPPTVTVAALEEKVRIAESIDDCDIRFFMGATEASHLLAIRDVWRAESAALKHLKNRCCGLKIYLDHSTGNQRAEHGVITGAFTLCGELGIPLVAHCEEPGHNARAAEQIHDTSIASHSLRRPPESEEAAIASSIALAKQFNTHFHVAHLSAARGVELVREAKAEGLHVTCEVAPHHLFLTTDDYEILGTLGKMNPPLRSHEDQHALWDGIMDGTVDCIATDHAPHTLKEKQAGDPLQAPSGVPGVETMFPLLLTAAMQERISYSDIVRLCFENPNRIFGLGKTEIVIHGSADIVVVDPEEAWVITSKNLHSPCGWTPYEGLEVQGRIREVITPPR